MWHSIHKQFISGLAEEDATNAVLGANHEKELKERSYHASINNIQEGNQQVEIHKLFAINLVQEAIVRILLRKDQDQLSETQSITSDITHDQELPKETRRVKSGKKSPRNLSNLKRWILLQRFLNELEKGRKSKPRNPSHLPLESDPESEKVYLRHQPVDERKRSEVRMFDYAISQAVGAIRQVVGQLAPTQKRKVEILVKAFETIVPPQGDHSTQVSWPHLEGESHESVFLASKADTTEDIKQEAQGKGMPKFNVDVDVQLSNGNGHQNHGSTEDTKPEAQGKGMPKFDVDVQLFNGNGHRNHGSTEDIKPEAQAKGMPKFDVDVLLSNGNDYQNHGSTEDIKPEAQEKGMPKFDVQLSDGNDHQNHGTMANDAQIPEKSADIALCVHEIVSPTEEFQQQINSQKMYSLSTGNLLDDFEPYSNLENRDEGSSTIQSTTCDIDEKPKVTEETELEQPEFAKENLEILAEENRIKSEAEQINNVAEESATSSSNLLQESTARNDRGTELKPERTLSRESLLDSRLKGNDRGESQQQINSQKMYSLSTGNLFDEYEASNTIQSTTYDIDVKPKVIEETELEQAEIAKENLEILAEEMRMKSEAEHLNNVAEESLKATGSPILLQESTARNDGDIELKPEHILSRESSFDFRLRGNGKDESQLDKEHYIRMWHMTYQHVASNIASKVGSHLLGGREEDKKAKEFNTSPRVVSRGESSFSKSYAVKLIQEAVDEILLHEVPDDESSDTQSVASETTPDQDLYGKNRDEVWNKSISSTTSVLNEEYVREFYRSDSGISVEEAKSTLPKPKSWRKLKRIMLLKGSMKAMEKATKFKSLLPRKNLPTPSDAEPEIVYSKHQMMNERKKAEQWMLDYAPAEPLTPMRKKRVAMLVEAFEAVVPLPEI